MRWPKVDRNHIETLALEMALLPIKAVVGMLFFIADWALAQEEEKNETSNTQAVSGSTSDRPRFDHPTGNYRSGSATRP